MMPQLFWNIERMRRNFFGTVRQKIFNWNVWYPLLCIKFPFSQNIWNIEGMPTKYFGTVRPQIFAGKMWYTLLCIKFFDTQSFLKLWTDAHEIFRHCETTNFRRKDVIQPVMHKIFVTPIYVNHRTDAHGKIRQCEPKIFQRKFVIPPNIHKMFRYLKLSETLKGCPKKFFGRMRSKNFAGKRDSLFYTWNFSIPQLIWNIERKPTKNFGTVRQKKIQLKNAISLTMQNFFRYPQIIWIIEGMPTKVFGNVRQKFSDGNLLYPLLSIKFFDTSNYLEHWRDAPRSFSVLWDPKISPENAIAFIIHETFRYPKFLKHWADAYKTFRHCETKSFQLKNVIPPTMHKISRYPKLSEILKGCPQNISALRDHKLSPEKCDTPCYA